VFRLVRAEKGPHRAHRMVLTALSPDSMVVRLIGDVVLSLAGAWTPDS
jgi:hypothetical protein